MSRILVTGGAGFIGSHVADAFVAAGHEVTIVDNLAHGRRTYANPNAAFYQIDIRDAGAVDGVFVRVRPEYVSHHAALVNVREAMGAPVEYAEVNLIGSIKLLESARRHGTAKFLYACTGGAAYGEGRGEAPFREDRPPRPLDPYGISKVAFEFYLDSYRQNYGLDFVSLRYANVYGPRQDPFGEGGVVAIFARHMAEGEPCTINGNGEKVRDFVYVGDVGHANVLALQHGSGIYNISTGLPTTISTVFQQLKAANPGYDLAPAYAPDKPGEVWASCLDAGRARAELGWESRVSLAEGLALTGDWFRTA